jgi:lipase ATG15
VYLRPVRTYLGSTHTSFKNLVKNLTTMYPNANVWLVGHSLGGALASLLGTTFGFPAVAFESPGERLAAQRLRLPMPPLSNISGLPIAPVTHIYHSADPIPQGACTGFRSPCASAGYALETRCHLGKSIMYDTVGKLGWRVSLQKHPIKKLILDVLEIDQEWEEGRNVPLAVEESDCIVRQFRNVLKALY